MAENIESLIQKRNYYKKKCYSVFLVNILLLILNVIINPIFLILCLFTITIQLVYTFKYQGVKNRIRKIQKNHSNLNTPIKSQYSEDQLSYKNIKTDKIKIATGILNPSNEVYSEFIVVDTETTGLSPTQDFLIELAAARFKDGQVIDTFETFINPQIPIPPTITKINNITDEMVKNSPTVDIVLHKFLEFIEDLPLVAHNASFDIKFLNANLSLIDEKICNPVIDTLSLSRKIFKTLPNHKLNTIRDYLGISSDDSHRALPDCLACAQIYLSYSKEVANMKNEINTKKSLFTIDADSCYEVVKDILIKNHRSLDYVKTKLTGTYFDINAFYLFVRLKLNGRKQYILLDEPKEELETLFENITFEDATSKEIWKTRAIISKPEDLLYFETQIIKQYDQAMDSMEGYRNNVTSGERNIQSYLSE